MHLVQVRVTDDFWTAWMEISWLRCILIYWNNALCLYICALMSKPHSIHREARSCTKPRPFALQQTAPWQICYRMIASFALISRSRCCWNASLMCRRTGEVALSIQTFSVMETYALDDSKMYCNFLGHHSVCFCWPFLLKVKVLTDFFVHILNGRKFW